MTDTELKFNALLPLHLQQLRAAVSAFGNIDGPVTVDGSGDENAHVLDRKGNVITVTGNREGAEAIATVFNTTPWLLNWIVLAAPLLHELQNISEQALAAARDALAEPSPEDSEEELASWLEVEAEALRRLTLIDTLIEIPDSCGHETALEDDNVEHEGHQSQN